MQNKSVRICRECGIFLSPHNSLEICLSCQDMKTRPRRRHLSEEVEVGNIDELSMSASIA
jgi:hypothetical protein